MPDNIENALLGGITGPKRQYLDLLNRHCKGPFKIKDAEGILGLPYTRVIRLLAYFTERGWLTRVKHGLYITVPLGTLAPAQRKEDPWKVAAMVFEPCYIGGWSACEHWGFTEQIFNNVVVITGKKVRTRNNSIQGFGYLVRSVPLDKIFGIKTEWRDQTKIQVSNPSKTIADLLDDPSLGGGIRHIVHILGEYFRQDTRNDEELLSCLGRNGNRAAYKRLGYLVEALKVDSPMIIETCKARMSKGYSMLDTTIKSKDKVLRRWNLWLNVTVEGQELY